MRVGVIGGGQLAWMMADAAKALGVDLIIQTPHQDDPAVAIATHTIFAPVADVAATAVLASQCDVITFENEFVDLEGLSHLVDQGVHFYPQLATLAPLLDKYHQRCYLRDIGLPTPAFALLSDIFSLLTNPKSKTQNLSFPTFPLVLKARRHGYDGQGTFIVQTQAELEAVLQQFEQSSGQTIEPHTGQMPFIVEEFIPFERELAVMAARSRDGAIAIYPVVETQQVNQVCRRVLVTRELSPVITAQVEAIAHTLLHQLQVVGILGIELFLTRDGKVLVNEIAPRTHNSGHFTLNACETSQFEQQLRAVCGLPLGSAALRSQGAVMVNLLGYEHAHGSYLEQRQHLDQLPHTFLYWYGKATSRPGRKLGHVTTLLDGTAQQRRSQALAAIQAIESIWYPN